MLRPGMVSRVADRNEGVSDARVRVLAVAAAALLLATPALARAEGLTLETGSPDALCPELEATRDAVRRRLGELVVPGGSFRARYTIAHAPSGTPRDFVRLELYGPEGTLRLERDLPLEESCSTMAEVIALVLDRYFRALLAGEPGAAEAGPEVQPSPAPPANAAVAAPAADAGATAPARVAPADSAPTRALLAGELGVQSAAGPMLGARALVELWPHLYAGTALHVALTAQSETLDGGGEVSGRSADWRLFGAWGGELGPVLLYAGPGFSFRLTRGEGEGLEDGQAGYRGTWAVGLDAGALWMPGDGWMIGAVADLDLSITNLGGRFDVQGQSDEVLKPETLQGWFGVAAGYGF